MIVKEMSEKRRSIKWIFLISILFFFFVLAAATQIGLALPVFARKYQTSCHTCHVMVPKLNPFGIAFRNNGYRIPWADEKFVKSKDIALGAPAWKQVWPNAVWPGAIPGLPPIALRVLNDVKVTPSKATNVDFDMPHELEAYFAGTSGESVGFFGEIEIDNTSTLSIERAYVQFDSLLNTTLLNMKMGRIDLRADPFSRSYRRMTSQHFNVSDLQVVSGQPKLRDRQAGLEIWGAATGPGDRGGLEYGLGVANGVPKLRETDNFKDYYWAVSYKIGGMGLAGSKAVPESLSTDDNYSEYSVLIGSFGYVGKWNKADVSSSFLEDQYDRVGVKFDAYLNKLNLYGAAVWGQDDLIGLEQTTSTIDSSAFFVEADYMLIPWVMPLFRFEKTNFSDRRNIIQMIPAVRLALRANASLLLEGRLFNSKFKESDLRTGTNEMIIRFDLAF